MPTAEQVLDVARGWIGYSDANGGAKTIIDIYNADKPLPRGYPVQYDDAWCDVFVTAVAIKAKAVDIIGKECGVEKHVNIFKNKGIWIEDGTITPKSGDLIVFNWDKDSQPNDGYSDHIGFVETVSNGVITTIEGNVGRACKRRTFKVGHGNIRGFARPKYSGDTPTPPQPEPEDKLVEIYALRLLCGEFGNEDNAKRTLGNGYSSIRSKADSILSSGNWKFTIDIDGLAKRTIRGEFGSGNARRERLGCFYYTVQSRVNKILKGE